MCYIRYSKLVPRIIGLNTEQDIGSPTNLGGPSSSSSAALLFFAFGLGFDLASSSAAYSIASSSTSVTLLSCFEFENRVFFESLKY